MDLSPYANLRERQLRRRGFYVGEGRFIVERMLASGWPLHSILCAPRLREEMEALADSRCPVHVLSESEIARVAGFPFHRGVLAAGRRPHFGDARHLVDAVSEGDASLVVCADLVDAENLGTIIRTSAGLGAAGVLLGRRCCDPLGRRVIRVSMGAVFHIPLAVASDDREALAALRKGGYALVGTVAEADARPLEGFRPKGRVAVVLGNEGMGLDGTWRGGCDALVTIPMRRQMDSLNVGVAAGIVLYELRRGRRGPERR